MARILIIGDDYQMIELFRLVLKREGFKVVYGHLLHDEKIILDRKSFIESGQIDGSIHDVTIT